MANAFSPDVGMDIGASNVRPYQPDAIDYSSLGKAFSGLFPEAAAPTEGQRDDAMIAPFAADLYRIDQIEDPNKKEIYFRQAYKSALATMPGQVAKVKSVYDEFRGISLPTGSPISIGQKMLEDFQATTEGQTAVIVAQSKAMRPDGTMDNTLYSAALTEAAFRYNQEVATNARLEREIQIGDKSAEVQWEGSMLPAMITKSNRVFTEVTSDPVVAQILKGQGGAVPIIQLIDALKAERSNIETAFMQQKSRAGITSGDEKYSLKPVLQPWDNLITTLEANSTMLQRSSDLLVGNDKSNFILNAKGALERMALSDQNVKSQLVTEALQQDPQRLAKLKEYILAPSFQENAYVAPESDQGEADAIPIENLNIEARAKVLPEFSKDAIATVSQKPVQWKQEQIRAGLFLLNSFPADTIKTSGQAISFADAMGYTYLSLIDRSQSSPSKSSYIQDILGTKAFANMAAVSKASPTTGTALYKQAHKYAKDEVNKQVDSLTANFATIASMDMNPFELVLEKGQFVLKLNEQAVKNDMSLKRAMASAAGTMYGTAKSGGPQNPRLETDPLKVMESYMGLFNLGSGRYSDIVDNIKSINILYNQMGQFPDEIKNSEYSGQVYLADRVSRLPGYDIRPTTMPSAQPEAQ